MSFIFCVVRQRKSWYLLFIGCAIFWAGCSNQDTEATSTDGERILVDGSRITDSEDISRIIDEIRVVVLEENEGNFIGEIDNVLMHGKNYVILDKYVGKQALVFDSTGKYVAKLGDLGRGPNELSQINSIWTNHDGGIDLYDFAIKKIVSYDKDYRFSNTFSVKNNPAAFQAVVSMPHSNDYVAFAGYSIQNEPYDGNHYRLAFLNRNFDTKRVARTYDADLSGALISTPVHPFAQVNDTIRFFENFDNTIYDINPDGRLSKRYTLDYGREPFPADFESSIIKPNLSLFKANETDFAAIQQLYKGFLGFNGVWLETEKYVVFESFDDNYLTFTAVYDKQIKETVAQSRGFADSTRYYVMLPPLSAVDYQENRFVAVYPGYVLRSIVMPKSPFFELIDRYPESNFLFEVTMK